jgi:hypothetical protein
LGVGVGQVEAFAGGLGLPGFREFDEHFAGPEGD